MAITKICLDVEGVLLPEIWQVIAKATGIQVLMRTTRDEPDYNSLMRQRLATLSKHRIGMSQIDEIIRSIDLLPGASEFLKSLRSRYQVALISDSFYPFLSHFAKQLNWPELYCHSLAISDDGALVEWIPRVVDQKRKCVSAFQALGFSVFAAGDSFNDFSMLEAADGAAFIHAPEHISSKLPLLPRCHDYQELDNCIRTFSTRPDR